MTVNVMSKNKVLESIFMTACHMILMGNPRACPIFLEEADVQLCITK
jgi:hypothetical protein